MNNEQNLPSGDLDSLIGDNHMQMMKAALPYMNVPEQRFISLFVKFNELRRTIHLFDDEGIASMGICSAGEAAAQTSPMDMLNTIKPFATPTEQDFIDLVSNFFQGFFLADAVQDSVPGSMLRDAQPMKNFEKQPEKQAERQSESQHRQAQNPLGRIPFEQIKNFMPQEQQSKFETMQLMMSAMQQMN